MLLSRRFRLAVVLIGVAIGGLPSMGAPPLHADEPEASDESLRPTGHFRVENAASLSDADALAIYQRTLSDMVEGYALSKLEAAGGYAGWRRYNKAPYRSAQHGERFVSNYANATAAAYGRYEQAGTLPVGSVVAKDSFTVTENGNVYSGALFLMEKMEAGFNPESRDWRYSMIMPDGSLFGTTKGEGDDRVQFCITCHQAAGDALDHLFFPPDVQRIQIGE